jgi:bifunctional ADP-heptose synthase (sugar kinase/adenylyltransferase)
MSKEKIVDWESLKKEVEEWQRQGLRIVFTNGCFDILHIGHARYLAESGKTPARGRYVPFGDAVKPGSPGYLQWLIQTRGQEGIRIYQAQLQRKAKEDAKRALAQRAAAGERARLVGQVPQF